MSAGRRASINQPAKTPQPSQADLTIYYLWIFRATPPAIRGTSCFCFSFLLTAVISLTSALISRIPGSGPPPGRSGCHRIRLPSSLAPTLSPSARTYMPVPPNPGLLAQCTTTLLCHLRSVPLWIVVVVVFVFGALRARLATLLDRNPRPPTPAAASAHKRTA